MAETSGGDLLWVRRLTGAGVSGTVLTYNPISERLIRMADQVGTVFRIEAVPRWALFGFAVVGGSL